MCFGFISVVFVGAAGVNSGVGCGTPRERWDETEQKVVVFGVEGVEGVIGVRCLLQNKLNNNKKKMPHVNVVQNSIGKPGYWLWNHFSVGFIRTKLTQL